MLLSLWNASSRLLHVTLLVEWVFLFTLGTLLRGSREWFSKTSNVLRFCLRSWWTMPELVVVGEVFLRALISSLCTCCIDRLQVLKEVCWLTTLKVLKELLVELAFESDFQSALKLLLRGADFTDDCPQRATRVVEVLPSFRKRVMEGILILLPV